MTPEELLRPRFLVIADYPNSECFIDTVIQKELIKYRDSLGFLINDTTTPEDYPAIFKKLEWWERRNVEDMPMYLKQTGMVDSNDEPIPDWYLKVKKHFNAGNGEWRDDSYSLFCIERCERTFGTCMNYSDFEPSTEEEYKKHNP